MTRGTGTALGLALTGAAYELGASPWQGFRIAVLFLASMSAAAALLASRRGHRPGEPGTARKDPSPGGAEELPGYDQLIAGAGAVPVRPPDHWPDRPDALSARDGGALSALEGQVGTGTTLRWPAGIGVEGNPGVAEAVAHIPFSIGYIERSYSKGPALFDAAIRNQAGNYVTSPAARLVVTRAIGAPLRRQLARMVPLRVAETATRYAPAECAFSMEAVADGGLGGPCDLVAAAPDQLHRGGGHGPCRRRRGHGRRADGRRAAGPGARAAGPY